MIDVNDKEYKLLQGPSQKLINQLYEFIFCAKKNLPNDINKLYSLLKKVFETTSLKIDQTKLKYVTIALFEKMKNGKNGKENNNFHAKIKKYIVDNKQIPFSKDKWKQIISTKIVNDNSNKKLIGNLSKWAANLVQSQWNVHQEWSNIISSNNIQYILYTEKSNGNIDDDDQKQQESIMEYILNNHQQKLFGLVNNNDNNNDNNVTFCVDQEIIDKYKEEDTKSNFADIINKCIQQQILQIVPNINELYNNQNDMILIKLTKNNHANNDNNKTMNVSALHQKLFVSHDEEMWDRKFFDSL